MAKWLSVPLRTKWFWVRIPAVTLTLNMAPASSKEFLDIQANCRVRFNLKLVRDMIITYSVVSKFDLANLLWNRSSRFNSKFATLNFNMGTCSSQFRWNLQFLTCYSLFRNLLCSATNLLTFEVDTEADLWHSTSLVALWL